MTAQQTLDRLYVIADCPKRSSDELRTALFAVADSLNVSDEGAFVVDVAKLVRKLEALSGVASN